MSATVEELGHDVHDDGHHDHPSYVAHHFETAEQQYDAGKLGMWLFLVTEVLFFSGMFCAYAYYRSTHPEVFQFSSQYLNKFLGAINTGVLLFSSLTMAWAVRAAQLAQPRVLVGMLGATLSCAAIFLGVKAVEYTHKWDLGLLPAAHYVAQLNTAAEHHSNYLMWLCVVPAIIAVGTAFWYFSVIFKKDKYEARIAGPIFTAALSFFGGVGLGILLTAGEGHSEHHGDASASHAMVDAKHSADAHANVSAVDVEIAQHGAEVDQHTTLETQGSQDPVALPDMYASQANANQVARPLNADVPSANVNQKSEAGIFFSIYYAMTGVHAVHILIGMGVITWLIIRAARNEFHSQYFGPVDNVGLYWHLVDFIWIYLFPLLYLIT